MESLNTPILKILKEGDTLKLYEVTGRTGMSMPLHYSTREAIVIIQDGSAVLHIDDQKLRLQKNDCYIIPAGRIHSLQLKTEFKSLVIMGQDSKIEFV